MDGVRHWNWRNSHISLTMKTLQHEVASSEPLPSLWLGTPYSHSWEQLTHGKAPSVLPQCEHGQLQARSTSLNGSMAFSGHSLASLL